MTAIHPAFRQSAQKSSAWVDEVMHALGLEDSHQALRALRAGLHALRDRMPPHDVVDLGAQLPMLIRGLYYEGWRLAEHPERISSVEDLVELVRAGLDGDRSLDPVEVLRAVIKQLAWHISRGELDAVAAALPRSLAPLWTECLS